MQFITDTDSLTHQRMSQLVSTVAAQDFTELWIAPSATTTNYIDYARNSANDRSHTPDQRHGTNALPHELRSAATFYSFKCQLKTCIAFNYS